MRAAKTERKLLRPSGGELDTATVLREFVKNNG
jgi:hypothetical protein